MPLLLYLLRSRAPSDPPHAQAARARHHGGGAGGPHRHTGDTIRRADKYLCGGVVHDAWCLVRGDGAPLTSTLGFRVHPEFGNPKP
jgi:hypothetical protein